jgi:hypothetical protein
MVRQPAVAFGREPDARAAQDEAVQSDVVWWVGHGLD